MDTDALARYCESLWNARTAINSTMDEIARYVAPDRQGFTSGKLDASDEGRDRIWDSTPEDAALTLASALHGMLTNPATEWLALDLTGLEEETDEETDEFLQNVNKAMLDVFSDADTGFQQEVNTFYMDLVCFGWAVFLCEMKDGKGLRFRAVPPSQCAIAENSDGRVDTVLRRWEMTPGQMVEEFGADALSGQVKDALEGKNQSKTFLVSHLVAPREKMPGDLQSAPARTGNFVSVYFETQNKNILREGIFSPCSLIVSICSPPLSVWWLFGYDQT
jgi:hypothetical protein